jgi:hypothetical protein
MVRRSLRQRLQRYLQKQSDHLSRPLLGGSCDGIDQVVVIPALAEAQTLFHTLADLSRNPADERARTLVICVVNNRAEPDASRAEIESNQRTLQLLELIAGGAELGDQPPIKAGSLRLAYVDASSPGKELAAKQGVGAARKIGLDHALAVLAENRAGPGLLLCLDADTRVSSSYLAAVRRHFKGSSAWAGTVDYEHPIPERPALAEAIVAYEIFLRYSLIGLRYADSAYAYPPIGSITICTANAYAASGGMNRRQAGEDFYFLQGLAKTGAVDPIQTTTALPSPRISQRVPFGTGATISRLSDGAADSYLIYNPICYEIIRQWHSVLANGLEASSTTILKRADRIAPQLADYLAGNRFPEVWPRLQANAASRSQLWHQVLRWFDAFKTLKLIHFLRDHGYPNQPLETAVHGLLELCGSLDTISQDDLKGGLAARTQLLLHLRGIDRRQARRAGVEPTPLPELPVAG